MHGHWVESQGGTHLATVNATFQLGKSAKTANEIYALAGTEIFNVEYLVEDETAGDVNVKYSNGVVIVVCTLLCLEAVPMAVEIERELV